jgi:hypothetical protein
MDSASNKRKTDNETGTNRNKKRMEMRPEVKAAVDDILNGVTVNSATEWVQREYLRLMRREASKRQNESILSKNNTK